jgi:hypothetical protein
MRSETCRCGTFSFTEAIAECCRFLGVRTQMAAHLE